MSIQFYIYDYHKLSPILKKLKILCRKTTGETLKLQEGDITIIGVIENTNKLVCMCNISDYSPDKHFEESCPTPYLYNYLCDFKYNKRKYSYKLMEFIKQYVMENDKYQVKKINLNTLDDSGRAKTFFEKNGFRSCGTYMDSDYIKYTFCFDSEDETGEQDEIKKQDNVKP